MRVLFEIVHPADVLFFKRPIENLIARGDEVMILSRHKDIACDLLDAFGFAHIPITSAGSGLVGLACELVARDIAVFRHVRSFRPNVMIGFGGVSISHVGKLLRTKSISFYDSENATLQTSITWPFISELYVPVSYTGPTPIGRTIQLKGTKDLSFLHPAAFTADESEALAAGFDPATNNYFVRLVSWRANHDLGKDGWTEDLLRKVVNRLSDTGRVHLSSEVPLPADLAGYAYSGPKSAVHHLLAHCRLLIGESATMASEAAILGVPAIYSGRDFPGYVRELERAGLIRNIEEFNEPGLLAVIDQMLALPPSRVRAARDAYVASCPDWAEVVVEALDKHGQT